MALRYSLTATTFEQLHPRHQEFIRLYCSGPDGVRGNATNAYLESHPDSTILAASSSGAALLGSPNISAFIAQFHAEAQAKAIAKIRDWKELAPRAQEIILGIAEGTAFAETVVTQDGVTTRRRDAMSTAVQLRAAMYIVDRAYPTKRHLEIDARSLGAMLGVPAEALPPPTKQVGPPLSRQDGPQDTLDPEPLHPTD